MSPQSPVAHASTRPAFRRWLKAQIPLLYWRVLVGGAIILYALWEILINADSSFLLGLYLLLLGSLFPTVFAIYWRERYGGWPLARESLLVAASLGVVAGLIVGFVVYGWWNVGQDSLFGALLVVVLEEVGKLAPLAYFLRHPRFASERDGLVLGVAAALGFSAAETFAAGLAAFHLIVSDFGGFMSPFAFVAGAADATHIGFILVQTQVFATVAWTAILAAVLWRERGAQGQVVVNRNVVLAAGGVVVVHTLWVLGFAHAWLVAYLELPLWPYPIYFALFHLLLLAPLSYLALSFFVREARERANAPAGTTPPLDQALPAYAREVWARTAGTGQVVHPVAPVVASRSPAPEPAGPDASGGDAPLPDGDR
ncbi:MAG: hypothetical protein ACHQ4H_05290 [Ktedonobacterales bacterium]